MARLIRIREVEARTGHPRSRIYELIREGGFPRQVKLDPNGRTVGWVESEVDQWINERIHDRDQRSEIAEQKAATG